MTPLEIDLRELIRAGDNKAHTTDIHCQTSKLALGCQMFNSLVPLCKEREKWCGDGHHLGYQATMALRKHAKLRLSSKSYDLSVCPLWVETRAEAQGAGGKEKPS